MLNKVTTEKKAKKNQTSTIRLDDDMDTYIEKMSIALTRIKGMKATRTWVMTNLMRLGIPKFEAVHGIKRAKKTT